MSWTKRQLIESAFIEAGLAAFAFDLTPAQLLAACRQLDNLMTAWDADGIKLGYAFTLNPDNSEPDTPSNVPPFANDAVVQNLAVRIGPAFGKMISPETKDAASRRLSSLSMRFAVPNVMKVPGGTYLGQGNKTDFSYFTPDPDMSPLSVDDVTGQLDFGD
jgi:hypothetical protein